MRKEKRTLKRGENNLNRETHTYFNNITMPHDCIQATSTCHTLYCWAQIYVYYISINMLPHVKANMVAICFYFSFLSDMSYTPPSLGGSLQPVMWSGGSHTSPSTCVRLASDASCAKGVSILAWYSPVVHHWYLTRCPKICE